MQPLKAIIGLYAQRMPGKVHLVRKVGFQNPTYPVIPYILKNNKITGKMVRDYLAINPRKFS